MLFAVGVVPVDGHVRVGDSGLFEVFIDATSAAFVHSGQFDRYASTRFDFGARSVG